MRFAASPSVSLAGVPAISDLVMALPTASENFA